MEYNIKVYSKEYCPIADSDIFTAQVDKHLWERIMTVNSDNKRTFLKINDWIIPIGSPVPNDSIHNVYLPLWIIDTANIIGVGEEYRLTVLSEDAFPSATKITFKIIDKEFYNSDIKEELEIALTQIGVIKQDTTIQIPIASLGVSVDMYVSATEPANIVLCDGDDIEVEFEDLIDVPIPEPVQAPRLEAEPIPEYPRLPTVLYPDNTGNVLGSSGDLSHVPEWRRNLPPPKKPKND